MNDHPVLQRTTHTTTIVQRLKNLHWEDDYLLLDGSLQASADPMWRWSFHMMMMILFRIK